MKKQSKIGLAWCKAHRNLPIEFWQNILFPDETIIEIHPFNAMNRIRRFSFENPFQKKYICPKVKFPNKIMFWGAISARIKSNLVPIDGLMNSSKYITEIIEKEVQPIVNSDHTIVFQQDNAGCHTAHKVYEYFEKNDIKYLKWPSHSPDLNIIENIWQIIKRRLNKITNRNKQSLITSAKMVWNEMINDNLILKLANSMPSRIQAVIDNKGHPTKY